jgi:hypothetical protein
MYREGMERDIFLCKFCVGKIRSDFISEMFIAVCFRYCISGEWSQFEIHPKITNILHFLESIGIILVIETLDSYWIRPLGMYPTAQFQYKVCVCKNQENFPSIK